MKTVTNWIKEQEYESEQDHNRISMDGNRKNGFSPKALLLSGLAACSGIDLVDILKKMKIEVKKLEITVETEQTEQHPKVFKDITLVYKINSEPWDENKTRKAIDLSLEKYCGVAAMLRKNSAISYTVKYF